VSKKSECKRAREGDTQAMNGMELLLNTDKGVVAQCMIDAGDDIPTRKKKLAQFFRDMPLQDTALARAQEMGDRNEFARYLEKGGEVTDEMRKFLADVLRGDKRKNTHRPREERIETRNQTIALMVLRLKDSGVRPTAAKQLAAEKFNLDFRSVQRASAKWESFVEPVSKIEMLLFGLVFGADETTARAHMLASSGISQDEVLQLRTPRRRK